MIFTDYDEQAGIAREVLERNAKRFRVRSSPSSSPRRRFWRAEEYHQCYLEKRHSHGGLMGQLLGR